MRSLLLSLVLLPAATAATHTSFNFDGVAPGTPASALAANGISFHNAVLAPALDAWGVEIPGSSYWQPDYSADALFPVSVGSPSAEGWGPAPSGDNALDARSGPVFLKFSQPVRLDFFRTVLDFSPFGDLGLSSILFVNDRQIVGSQEFDATLPGVKVKTGGFAAVTGVVLQGGAFYDNVEVRTRPVPDTASTLGLAGAALAGLVWMRRRR